MIKVWETEHGGYLDTVEKIDLFVRVVFPDGHSQDMKIQVKSSRTGEEEFRKKNPHKKDICVINGQQPDAEIQQVFIQWVEHGGR